MTISNYQLYNNDIIGKIELKKNILVKLVIKYNMLNNNIINKEAN